MPSGYDRTCGQQKIKNTSGEGVTSTVRIYFPIFVIRNHSSWPPLDWCVSNLPTTHRLGRSADPLYAFKGGRFGEEVGMNKGVKNSPVRGGWLNFWMWWRSHKDQPRVHRDIYPDEISEFLHRANHLCCTIRAGFLEAVSSKRSSRLTQIQYQALLQKCCFLLR